LGLPGGFGRAFQALQSVAETLNKKNIYSSIILKTKLKTIQ
jgi:hypothetical protein